jgi:uncharacterized membrane protein
LKQARFPHKSDFEHKSIKSEVLIAKVIYTSFQIAAFIDPTAFFLIQKSALTIFAQTHYLSKNMTRPEKRVVLNMKSTRNLDEQPLEN